MKLIKILALAGCIGLFFAVASYNWTVTKYPPCDLVVKGIGVSTFGCTNPPQSDVSACSNESPNSPAMVACINANYYRYKTIPFGFVQHFGDGSNKIDYKPAGLNALASFGLGFALATIALFVRSKTS